MTLNPFVAFRNWMHARQRKFDLEILWPACKKYALDYSQARAAFALHVSDEPAWRNHYEDEELVKFIEELT